MRPWRRFCVSDISIVLPPINAIVGIASIFVHLKKFPSTVFPLIMIRSGFHFYWRSSVDRGLHLSCSVRSTKVCVLSTFCGFCHLLFIQHHYFLSRSLSCYLFIWLSRLSTEDPVVSKLENNKIVIKLLSRILKSLKGKTFHIFKRLLARWVERLMTWKRLQIAFHPRHKVLSVLITFRFPFSLIHIIEERTFDSWACSQQNFMQRFRVVPLQVCQTS